MRAVTLLVSLAMLVAACGRPAQPGPAQVPQSGSLARQSGEPGRATPDMRVGAIFRPDSHGGSHDGSRMHVCSGSVLHSTGGDLVLTAAHCLLGGAKATFVPGFADTADPADIWTVNQIYLDPRWSASGDPRADFAIARVSGTAGSVEHRAGAALSLGTAPAPGTQVTVTGYPAGVGGQPISCQGSTSVTERGFPRLPCEGLVDGTSGAPWISGSTVVGVIGGFEGGGCTEDVSYSAPFDEHTAQLLARAEAGGSGDKQPTHYDDGC